MQLIPMVNVDTKMPKKMLEALTLFEAFCVGSKLDVVFEADVISFLAKRFSQDLANTFKSEYLISQSL